MQAQQIALILSARGTSLFAYEYRTYSERTIYGGRRLTNTFPLINLHECRNMRA